MKIKVYLDPSEEGGYTVIVPSLPGCISEGDTREEAIENIKEAIKLYLEPVDDDVSIIPAAEEIELSLWYLSAANNRAILSYMHKRMAISLEKF